MQRYQIVVNGNTYTVTVKSLIGNTAIVDVDGWEFQVAIADGDVAAQIPHLVAGASAGPAVASESAQSKPIPTPLPETRRTGRRTSALEDLAPKKTAMSVVEGKGVVAAHLPGLVTSILVKTGDSVKAGDVVLKMEAMKMENDIRAGIDGVVKEILVQQQQNVLENQPLLIIE
ncbi:MAG TPA: biotin/lipoyl-binding protein [Firmicutes bacterium]|nr:biotin/lipoyl-binding protein [Bacillota bacterium]